METTQGAAITPLSDARPLGEAKEAKKTLEVELQRLIVEYETRFNCEVSTVHVEPARDEAKQWRCGGVRVTVQL